MKRIKENNILYFVSIDRFLFRKRKEEWFNIQKKRSRRQNAAYIEYHLNGKIKIEKYYLNGSVVGFDEKKASEIHYYKNGNVLKKIFYCRYLIYGKEECYYLDGTLKKEIYYNNVKKKSTRHRDNDLPAEIHYYKNGKIKEEKWFRHGKLERREALSPVFIKYNNDSDNTVELKRLADIVVSYCKRNNINPDKISKLEKNKMLKYLNGPTL